MIVKLGASALEQETLLQRRYWLNLGRRAIDLGRQESDAHTQHNCERT